MIKNYSSENWIIGAYLKIGVFGIKFWRLELRWLNRNLLKKIEVLRGWINNNNNYKISKVWINDNNNNNKILKVWINNNNNNKILRIWINDNNNNNK